MERLLCPLFFLLAITIDWDSSSTVMVQEEEEGEGLGLPLCKYVDIKNMLVGSVIRDHALYLG